MCLHSSFVLAPLALALVACGAPLDAPATDNRDESSTYLAFAADFTAFRSWQAFPVPAGASDGTVHTSGPRTEYLKARPPRSSRSFPVGSIIVKELEEGALPDRKVFAMVKRGGDYNAQGAQGWEWFELKNLDESEVYVVWRGVGPPAGEMYGGDPNAGCNTCHARAADNDFVQSAALQLKDF